MGVQRQSRYEDMARMQGRYLKASKREKGVWGRRKPSAIRQRARTRGGGRPAPAELGSAPLR
jgi:hypothetical protein